MRSEFQEIRDITPRIPHDGKYQTTCSKIEAEMYIISYRLQNNVEIYKTFDTVKALSSNTERHY